MTADGRVLYRLTRINGRAERNEWRLIYQLGATERREIRTDTSKAVDLLARLAREARAPSWPGPPLSAGGAVLNLRLWHFVLNAGFT
jgi:hypothetical protein